MAIEWSPELAVGVPEIDHQHQELFRQASLLQEALQEASGAEAVESLLQFLPDYLSRRCAAEEVLMRARAYPGLPAHQAEHGRATQEIKGLVDEFQRTGSSAHLTMRLAESIHRTLLHITRTDKAFGDYLRSTR